ncbi:MAG: hypothetical protein HC859_11505 [Bacteroidia bacterium]|nr:hypothetical protein [Bacteroidia bacterium]
MSDNAASAINISNPAHIDIYQATLAKNPTYHVYPRQLTIDKDRLTLMKCAVKLNGRHKAMLLVYADKYEGEIKNR